GDRGSVEPGGVGVAALLFRVAGRPFPPAGNAAHARLPAESSFRTHLAGDAGHFGRERAELIDHRIDGVLQFKDLAADIDGDLLGQVAIGDGGGDLGDVAYLGGQVTSHHVDTVGQVLPGTGNVLDLSLSTESSFGTHLTSDTC